MDLRRRREAARAVQEGLSRYGATDLGGAETQLRRALELQPDHPRAGLYLGWVRRCLRQGAVPSTPVPVVEIGAAALAASPAAAAVGSGAPAALASPAANPAGPASPALTAPASGVAPSAGVAPAAAAVIAAPAAIAATAIAAGLATSPALTAPRMSFDSEPTRGEGLPLQGAAQTPVGELGAGAQHEGQVLVLSTDSSGLATEDGAAPGDAEHEGAASGELSLVMDLDGMESSSASVVGHAPASPASAPAGSRSAPLLLDGDDMDLADLVAAAEEWGAKITPSTKPAGRSQAQAQAQAQAPRLLGAVPQPQPAGAGAAPAPKPAGAAPAPKPAGAVPAPRPAAVEPAVPAPRPAAVEPPREPVGSELSLLFADVPHDPDAAPIELTDAPASAGGGTSSELSLLFADVPHEPVPTAGPKVVATDFDSDESGLSMLLSDVPLLDAVRRPGTTTPPAAAARPARPEPAAPKAPAAQASSELSMLFSDLPLSADSPAPVRRAGPAVEPHDDGAAHDSGLSLIFEDEPVTGQHDGEPPDEHHEPLDEDGAELLEDLDLTEDLLIAEDAHAHVVDLGAARSPDSPDIEISLEGALPEAVPHSPSASFPPPPRRPADVESRLRLLRESLDRQRPDEALSRAEDLIESLGGDQDPAALHPYEDRLAEIYERILHPMDRVPRVARYPTTRMASHTAFLLSLLDGSMTMEEALTISHMPRLTGARTMAQLLRSGLIKI